METVARNVIFTGRVQGVGFRYTVCHIASNLPITGYVRNMPGGAVEALFQGTEKDIQTCIDKIKDCLGQYIRDIDISPVVPATDYTDFDITF